MELQSIVGECIKQKDYDSNYRMLTYMSINARDHNMYDKGVKDHIHSDTMSFKFEVDMLNKKYMSIRNKIVNDRLVLEISKLTSYFEQWDIGRDGSASCEALGDCLLETINSSRHKNDIIKKIDSMFPIIHVSRDIWYLSSLKILFYTGFYIFHIVEPDEIELRNRTYDMLNKLLLWIFLNKEQFYKTYETNYNNCINAAVNVSPVLTVNFKAGPLEINVT